MTNCGGGFRGWRGRPNTARAALAVFQGGPRGGAARRWDPLLALERRSGDSQLLHLVDERSALQAKFCGRAVGASDYPTDFLQSVQNQSALRCLESSCRRKGNNTLAACRWQ